MKITSRYFWLIASVFFTGGSVLIVEIIATRILSPYYGNTIYTTSSVIGAVLAALSLGYYVGGILTDRFPYHRVFYGIITISGFLVILIEILGKVLLPLFSATFSISLGPVISSFTLFFIPAFCLGMLSPFAIKLNGQGIETIGKQSGQVFFWSTLGSIAGSFLAGFFLIPFFGIGSIIIFTGIFLGLWGIAGMFLFGFPYKKLTPLIILLLLPPGLVFTDKPAPGVLYEKDGLYEKITITEGEWDGKPTRFLFQDRSYSAAMYADSSELVYDYTKYYKLYQLFNKNPKRAFVMGGGAYSVPKAILSDSPNVIVDVAEIEPELFELSKKYFNLRESSRLNNYAEDGRRFLAKTDKKYDLILGDAYYSIFSIPIHLTTREFFTLVKSRLSEGGVFVGNFSGDLRKESPSFIYSEMRTFKEVFDNTYFFAVKDYRASLVQNIIFLGINGPEKIIFDSPELLESQDPIFRTLPQKNIDLASIDLLKYKAITDDYAPIEYLVSKVIEAWNTNPK